jgi:hypothetical protein
MSQRISGYKRQKLDRYQTPPWVTEALIPHLRLKPGSWINEPAAGTGQMVKALQMADFRVIASDIVKGRDFLKTASSQCAAVITNPPYGLADEFIQHALELMKPNSGLVAMLLRTDFDHAKQRASLFRLNPKFCKKVILTRRIRWFAKSTGSPSFNHAWFIWDWKHKGPPTLVYQNTD